LYYEIENQNLVKLYKVKNSYTFIKEKKRERERGTERKYMKMVWRILPTSILFHPAPNIVLNFKKYLIF